MNRIASHPMTRRGALAALAAGAMMVPGGRSAAATYPDRPVRIIVPFAPGGPTDIMARVVAAALGTTMGNSFLVENRPGAGGNLGMGAAARATPDGYTLLLSSSAYVLNPALYAQIPYDPFKDFVPLAELGASPNVFLARPQIGISSLAELIAYAKAKPGALDYSSPGVGTTPHLAMELLKLQTGVDITHVPYSGAGPAIQAILGGTVPIACTALPPAHPLIQAGTLKALALTSANRWFDLADVPTVVELDFPDVETDTVQALLAPAGTPPDIVAALARESVAAVKQPEIAAQLRKAGFEVIAGGPEVLAKRIAVEVPKWKALAVRTGVKVD